MAECSAPDCEEDAVSILSVGSLGVNDPLCQVHLGRRVLELERALIVPFHVTGLEAAPSEVEAAEQTTDAVIDLLECVRIDYDGLMQRFQELEGRHQQTLIQLASSESTLANMLDTRPAAPAKSDTEPPPATPTTWGE